MNSNLLDLNNDILNIMGDYVKQDNVDIMDKERTLFCKKIDLLFKILKRTEFIIINQL